VEPVHEKLYSIKDDKYSKIERKVAESIPSFTPFLFKSKYSPESKYKRYFRNNNNPQLKSNSIDSIRINAFEERPKSPRIKRKGSLENGAGTVESRFRAASDISQESIHLDEKKRKKTKNLITNVEYLGKTLLIKQVQEEKILILTKEIAYIK